MPVPLIFRPYPVQGDSRLSQVREMPLYAHAPVSDPGGVPHTRHIACRTDAFQLANFCRLSPSFRRLILADHNYTCFGIHCRGLRARFPSASHTPSQGSHFGSTTRLLATLWRGGILTRWASSTDFNAYRHLPMLHVSLGTIAIQFGPNLIPCFPNTLSTSKAELVHRLSRWVLNGY